MIKGCETAIRPSLLRERQGYSLRGKIYLSQQRIREWYEHWEGKVYVAFSGGKDSTVLLDLVRKLYPEVPGVFADTGLEYPEIKEFVHSVDNIEWIRPRMSYRQVISAADVGAPHLRKRIWIVAYPTKGNDGGSNREKASGQTQELGKSSGRNNLSDTPEQGFSDGRGAPLGNTGKTITESERQNSIRGGVQDTGVVSDTNQKRQSRLPIRKKKKYACSGKFCKDASNPNNSTSSRQRENSEEIHVEPEPTGPDLICGKDWWTTEPDLDKLAYGISPELVARINGGDNWRNLPIPRVAHGIPQRVNKLKGLGNAIVPQVAYLIMLRLKELI